jgi:hypothetical protein
MCLRLQNVSRYESLFTQATFCRTICTKDMCVAEHLNRHYFSFGSRQDAPPSSSYGICVLSRKHIYDQHGG